MELFYLYKHSDSTTILQNQTFLHHTKVLHGSRCTRSEPESSVKSTRTQQINKKKSYLLETNSNPKYSNSSTKLKKINVQFNTIVEKQSRVVVEIYVKNTDYTLALSMFMVRVYAIVLFQKQKVYEASFKNSECIGHISPYNFHFAPGYILISI